ncbi:MAG: invasion protein CiaB [Helicobacter sp.]|nr:invasion protein CiaB [Helicobacter sp.]
MTSRIPLLKDENTILSELAEVYTYLQTKNREISDWYLALEQKPLAIPKILEKTFHQLTLLAQQSKGDCSEETKVCEKEILLALLDRVVGLKENALENILEKLKCKESLKYQIKEEMLKLTQDFYVKRYEAVILYLTQRELLTPFLRELIACVHKIGLVFNDFFRHWQNDLILGINKDLSEKYKGDLSAILEALTPSFEVSKKGEISDRSYSVPVYQEGKYKAVAYASYFKTEFARFKEIFEEVLEKLSEIEEICPALEQKDAYLSYLLALKNALIQEDTQELLESWREVDKFWLAISTPLQIGHPLEYYEDHYRKSVAPEWDIRIARIYQGRDLLKERQEDFKISQREIWDFYQNFSESLPPIPQKHSINECVRQSLLQTQSYGGIPLAFYGAEFNGLFSAQVVPNDESVSAKFGKKIFYFPDRVWSLACAKPFMLLSSKTFCEEFLDFNRNLLFFRKNDWYKVYEITTIGHEFGHILWVDSESELKMNQSGHFKNIEEFKATMGGLAYYFTYLGLNRQREIPDIYSKSLLKEVIYSTISRAVGLIAWLKDDEVLPYYCEGLIHLAILFESGVLEYEGDFSKVALRINEEKFFDLVALYLETYAKLACVYLGKQDAKDFLEFYVILDKKGEYKPKNAKIRDFVEDYYAQYQAIGQVVDEITPTMWKKLHKSPKEGL